MKKYTSLTFCLTLLLFFPALALAQVTYIPLVGIPGLDAGLDFNTFINSLYWLSISIAALLAVIKLIIAGVKWMLTDVVTSKEEAKKDIKGALIGLLIVLGAVLILTVINPQLVNVNFNPEPVAAPSPVLLDTALPSFEEWTATGRYQLIWTNNVGGPETSESEPIEAQIRVEEACRTGQGGRRTCTDVPRQYERYCHIRGGDNNCLEYREPTRWARTYR